MLPLHWTALLNFLSDVKHRPRHKPPSGGNQTLEWFGTPVTQPVHLFYALVSSAHFISCPFDLGLLPFDPWGDRQRVLSDWLLVSKMPCSVSVMSSSLSRMHVHSPISGCVSGGIRWSRSCMPWKTRWENNAHNKLSVQHFARVLLPIITGRNGEIIKSRCLVATNQTSP